MNLINLELIGSWVCMHFRFGFFYVSGCIVDFLLFPYWLVYGVIGSYVAVFVFSVLIDCCELLMLLIESFHGAVYGSLCLVGDTSKFLVFHMIL